MIAIISGTNRPGSNTRKVAALAERTYGTLGAAPELIDLASLPAEIFAPTSYAEKPESFKRFSDGILNARGLVIVTPEYNGGMPGALKYFIDMLKFPESFESKPVCFIGLAAGMWGALRPVEQLQMIFGYRNAYLYPERVFIPSIHSALNEAGEFADAALAKRFEAQASGFLEFVRKIG